MSTTNETTNNSVKAYGSITIVDVTDVGEFSMYPTANLPLSVVYDPNQSGTSAYNPNWKVTPLTLSPVIYYAGGKLETNTPGLSVVWERKDGVDEPEAIDATNNKEVQTGHNLTVSENVLSTSPTGILTYICTATYNPDDLPNPLTAVGQITFSLMKNAPNVKTCTITGESVFKYNANNVVEGTGYITLTANVSNASVSNWLYKSARGVFTQYPAGTNKPNKTSSGTTLKVYPDEVDGTESIFVNDIATIRVSTNDSTVYDIHTITKLKDGAAGSLTVNAVLSNDDQWIACDHEKNPVEDAFSYAQSTISIFEGGNNVTDDWVIEVHETGVTGTYNEDTYTYSVTGMSADSADVEFECTKDGYSPIYKHFSLTKLIAAQDGVTPIIYGIHTDHLVINRDKDGKYSSNTVVFSAYSKEGNADEEEYNGYFKINVNDSEDNYYESANKEKSYTFTISDQSIINKIKCELYSGDDADKRLDVQSVIVTRDGEKGDKGDQGLEGQPATSVIIGNQADIITCNSSGKVKYDVVLSVPFTGYVGKEQAACTIAIPTSLPSGLSVKRYYNGTATQSGLIEFNVEKDATLGNNDSGTIRLQFACNGLSFTHYYQWSKSIQADNAVLLQIYALTGNVIENHSNTVTLSASLMDGSTDVTNVTGDSGPTYQWAKYQNGAYTPIPEATTKEFTVRPADVNGYASYQCTATYGGKPYSAYHAVLDKTDPIQAYVYCSLGTQILNSQGYGAIYTRIFRNGNEIDALKTERFLKSAPAQAEAGSFYYHLNTTDRIVTLMKFDGTSWSAAPSTDLPTASYTYTFRDKDGNICQYKGSDTVDGKVFYIDGTLVDKKVVIDVEVEV